MRGLPIRWKVTLAFTATLLVALTAIGAFIYLRLEAELGEALDRGLQVRSGEVSALVQRSAQGLTREGAGALETDESVAQVLDANGSVLSSTPRADFPLLTAGQLQRAVAGPVFADRPGDARIDESIRLLAVPLRASGDTRVLVVGASSDEKAEALASLLVLEFIGLGAALLVSGAAGYLVAGLALRPVEAMRRRAQEITDSPDQRLPVPRVEDELGRLGATLNAMLERLDRAASTERAAMARERRFVADASHELRTPLTILKSEIEVALHGSQSESELRAALRGAGEETDRLCRLAEALLLLAESDDGELAVRREPVAVGVLLQTVAGRHRPAATRAGRHIRTHAPADLQFPADASALERALSNLLDNALRHGGGDVELAGEAVADAVILTVRDHGPGFAPDVAPHAFERFRRASTGRSRAGAGLGLAIVDAVARAHGGSAEAGDAGPGARVSIRIPVG